MNLSRNRFLPQIYPLFFFDVGINIWEFSR